MNTRKFEISKMLSLPIKFLLQFCLAAITDKKLHKKKANACHFQEFK